MKSGQLVCSQFCVLHALYADAVMLEDESGGQPAIALKER